MKTVKLVALNLLALLVFGFNINQSNACTGIRLTAGDGSVVYGRSMEWGTFDLNSRVATIPRGHSFTGLTPDGNNGKKWKGKYAVVGLDMLHKDYLADGMNEKGLAVGLFYHPGFASYMEYKPSMAEETITAVNIVNFILSQFASVEEVRAGMKTVQVVPVIEKALGIPVNAHWIVTDATGISIVIEFTR